MKHVFSVHSPITFLVAHAVIEHLNLELHDIIILANNYDVPLKKYNVYPSLSSLNWSKTTKLLKMNMPVREDKYISEVTGGEEFVAYIDVMSYHQRVVITHPLCKSFNFIEEGNASYRDYDELEDLTWDKRLFSYRLTSRLERLNEVIRAVRWAMRGYSHRLVSVPYSIYSYAFFNNIVFYGLSDLAFPRIPSVKKETIKLKPSLDIKKLGANFSVQNSVIWVDGSNSRITGLPEEIYERAIDIAIEKLKPEMSHREVYVKLRPGTKDFAGNYLYSRLRQCGFRPKIMPDNLVIECAFILSKNCIVIGNLSSALFYASIYGHKAYSIYSLYEKRVATVFDNMAGYWKEVEKL